MLKDDILLLLEKNPEKIITGGALAEELSVSRTAVWKAINALKVEGYSIESLKNKGYILNQNNDVLSEYLIKSVLKTQFIGNTIEIFKSVDSTNQYLKKKNFLEIKEGLVVVSNEQTAGKGRRGRVFYSPDKEGIYFSLFLKPTLPISDIHFLTLAIAVAVAKSSEKVCNFNPHVKWVNDIYYNYKKLCGILTEATLSTENSTIDGVVIGVGINTGLVSSEVEAIAISIEEITGRKGFKNQLIGEILNQFETIYGFIQSDLKKGKDYILSEYKKRLFIIGTQVWVIDDKTEFVVTVIDIDEEGALVVENKNHEIIHLRTGEISLKLGGLENE